jgi:cytidine deaminase
MANNTVDPATRERLLDAALEVAHRAYAPYSKFSVGAAVLTESDAIFQGCNVENASYGLTNCAERTAIFSAAAAEGPGMSIRAIAVLTAHGEPATPCGACRQVMFEFNPDARVIFRGESGIEELTARELLPHGFRLE